jgi:hypothetical protein
MLRGIRRHPHMLSAGLGKIRQQPGEAGRREMRL